MRKIKQLIFDLLESLEMFKLYFSKKRRIRIIDDIVENINEDMNIFSDNTLSKLWNEPFQYVFSNYSIKKSFGELSIGHERAIEFNLEGQEELYRWCGFYQILLYNDLTMLKLIKRKGKLNVLRLQESGTFHYASSNNTFRIEKFKDYKYCIINNNILFSLKNKMDKSKERIKNKDLVVIHNGTSKYICIRTKFKSSWFEKFYLVLWHD